MPDTEQKRGCLGEEHRLRGSSPKASVAGAQQPRRGVRRSIRAGGAHPKGGENSRESLKQGHVT